MSLEYIRNYYGVPAHEGMEVEYEWPKGTVRVGSIVGACGPHLLLDFGDETGPVPAHPTWQLRYRSRVGGE